MNDFYAITDKKLLEIKNLSVALLHILRFSEDMARVPIFR